MSQQNNSEKRWAQTSVGRLEQSCCSLVLERAEVPQEELESVANEIEARITPLSLLPLLPPFGQVEKGWMDGCWADTVDGPATP